MAVFLPPFCQQSADVSKSVPSLEREDDGGKEADHAVCYPRLAECPDNRLESTYWLCQTRSGDDHLFTALLPSRFLLPPLAPTRNVYVSVALVLYHTCFRSVYMVIRLGYIAFLHFFDGRLLLDFIIERDPVLSSNCICFCDGLFICQSFVQVEYFLFYLYICFFFQFIVNILYCTSFWSSYFTWELDYTRTQMIVTIKMITLAYNVHDHLHKKPEVRL